MSVIRPPAAAPEPEVPHDDIIYPATVPFLLVHVACLAAIWTGVTTSALALAVALYLVRMFAVTAGYHRYFAHRSYRTSRGGQFVLALLAQTSAQRGVLWWAAKHRHHHRYSDTALDVHSPRQHGFWYAHLGWIFTSQHADVDLGAVPDLTRYPEMVWLDRHKYLPAAVLAVLVWLAAGWPGLVVGFFWSTVALYHGTFMINSLAHVHGRQRYVTGDDSRNNWWLSLITLGEGWHNNHHAYQRSTRAGFRWWEIDPTFYVLKALSWVRIVWDLGAPPPDLVRNERPLGRAVVEKVARQLAASFAVESLAAQVRASWAHSPRWVELTERLRAARGQLEELAAQVHLPNLPSLDELRARAEEMFAQTPSMDDIVERARLLLFAAVSRQLLEQAPAGA
ncbi:MAG: acyl-CoA desaturase [Gemmatimonadota bacterium]|nr:acyl-CoA desaturase [Gemmatimonadota bacterium]